ncbi:MAG TPA: hypothetical protein VIM10_12830 [Actinopolymorphaceae bacterium]
MSSNEFPSAAHPPGQTPPAQVPPDVERPPGPPVQRTLGWHARDRVVRGIGLKYRISGGFAKADVPGGPTVGLRTPITATPWLITVWRSSSAPSRSCYR